MSDTLSATETSKENLVGRWQFESADETEIEEHVSATLNESERVLIITGDGIELKLRWFRDDSLIMLGDGDDSFGKVEATVVKMVWDISSRNVRSIFLVGDVILRATNGNTNADVRRPSWIYLWTEGVKSPFSQFRPKPTRNNKHKEQKSISRPKRASKPSATKRKR